jgi:hypothetical protein
LPNAILKNAGIEKNDYHGIIGAGVWDWEALELIFFSLV